MQGTRAPLHLLLACAILVGAPDAVRAQDAAATEVGPLTLIPLLGGGTMGHRWEGGGDSFGPGPALFAGGAVQYRLTPTLAAELLGAYAWASSYSMDFGDQPGSRGAGDIDLLRVAVSGLWRMRANVPGYFSFGAGALHYAPQRRVGFRSTDADGVETVEPLFRDEAEWMPAAHVGAGIDITSGDHAARLDVRLYGSRSGQDVPRAAGDRLTPRLALDVQFYLGYLISL